MNLFFLLFALFILIVLIEYFSPQGEENFEDGFVQTGPSRFERLVANCKVWLATKSHEGWKFYHHP